MANWIIKPGVRQDHLGRAYQDASYPSGKWAGKIFVNGDARALPKGEVIPVPQEPKPIRRPILRLNAAASERRYCLTLRRKGENKTETLEYRDLANIEAMAEHIRPLVRFDGANLSVVKEVLTHDFDHYFQYVI